MRTLNRRLRALGIGVLAAAMAVGLGPAVAAGPPGTPDGVKSVRQKPSVSVTLLTGDRVILAGGDAKRAIIVPAKESRANGRSFQRFMADGHLYVIPSDLRQHIASGKLDRRLFDVTGLIKARYDDKHTKQIPLIVAYRGAAARDRLTKAGATATEYLTAVKGSAARVDKSDAAKFLAAIPRTGDGFGGGIDKIWLNGRARVNLDESVPQIGAPAAWDAGYTGQGVTVGVLDTGIDATHPDLAGQVAQAKDFSGEGPGDGYGHGTHVASTIAGKGAQYKGVAPDAKLLDGKVCDSGGWCTEEAILAGMEWAATEQDADVINLSLGGTDTPEVDPLEAAVNNLTASTGALFVISAGNSGPGAKSIGSPGSADAALTVGAVDKSDEIADFSSRGPRVGDGALKPDITAPGVDITAARAEGTSMGEPVGDDHTTASGTSMSAPHVTGSAALLAQQHPDWQAGNLKSVLMGSAKPHAELTAFDQGAGRVDVEQAITQSVLAEPASLSFGTAIWPHDDDEPVTKELTYRNTTGQAVTLTLAGTLTGPEGDPAPAGALTFSANTLMVPAGGTASVTATSNTKHSGPDGAYTGRVTATYAGGEVVTPIGVDKEVESYTLTLKSLDRAGAVAPVDATIFGLDTDYFDWPFDEDGEFAVRLPKGRYTVQAFVGFGSEDETLSFLVQPIVMLDGDMTWTADARQAKPMSVAVQDPRVSPALIDVGYEIVSETRGLGSSLWTSSFDGLYTAQVGPDEPVEGFSASLSSDWGVANDEGAFLNSPAIYKVIDHQSGRFWENYRKSYRDSDLATVVQQYNAQVANRTAYTYLFGFPPSGGWASATGFDFTLPGKTTLHLSPGNDLLWDQALSEYVLDEEGWPVDVTSLESSSRTYNKGKRYNERWNAAVFGPGPHTAIRYGDYLGFSAPLYSDQDGHLGFSAVDSASTVLYRNGEKVAESEYDGYVEVEGLAPEAADFTVTTTANRPTYSDFSTKETATWKFRSAATDPDEGALLPVWNARFYPQVDNRNRNHEKGVGLVPMRLTSDPESGTGRIRDVAVKVSTDDGKSWRKAALLPAGDDTYLVLVPLPKGAKFVSFQASAKDDRGNSVEQSIIRAYALG
jgi:subtilisin family serine protease